MADYYTVLNKAIAALADNTGESRRQVYDRARKALIRQLEAIDPPLSPSDITRQRLALEESVRKVEAEHANQSFGLATFPGGAPGSQEGAVPPTAPAANLAPPQAASQVPAPPIAAPETSPAPAAAPQPPVAAQPPIQSAPPLAPQAPPQTPPRDFGPNPLNQMGGTDEPAAQDVSVNAFRRAVSDAERLRNSASGASESALGAIAGAAPAAPPRVEPLVEAAPQGPPGTPQSAYDPAGASTDRPDPEFSQELDSHTSAYDDPEIERLVERSNKPAANRLPLLLGIAALVLVLIGGGIVFFLGNQSNLADLDLGVGDEVAATDSGPSGESLIGTDDPAASDPARVAPDAERVATRPVETPPVEGEPAVEQPTVAAEATTPETPSVESAIPVSQRAILYEETDDPGRNNTVAVSGNVIWRQRPNPDSETSQIADVEISIPERDFSMTMVVRENLDSGVGASNIIEVSFKLPEDYKGGSVTEIPGLILKSTENARGDLLIGTEVRIASNVFWLALSELPVDVTANRTLLSDREWVDVPLKFDNGQRGLIAFEKGSDGGRILKSVVDSWAPLETQ